MCFKKTAGLAIPFTILTALIIRLIALARNGDFWFDEMFSFVYSQKPWLDSFKYWAWETNPPLHALFLKLWFYIFPANELWARVPSLMFGIASVYLIYLLAKKMFGYRTALIAAAIMAIQPYHIFLSVNARTYSLLIMLSVLSIYIFQQIFNNGHQAGQDKYYKTKLFLLALVNLLLVYSHLTAWSIILGQMIIFFIGRKQELKIWLKAHILPLLLWLIWFAPSLSAKFNKNLFAHSWFLNIDYDIIAIIKNIQLLFLGPIKWQFGAIVILLFLIASFQTIKRQIQQKTTDKNFIFVNLLFIIPFIATALFRFWNVKFFLISLPWLTLSISHMIGRIAKFKISALLILLIAYACGSIYLVNGIFPIDDWQTVNKYISLHADPAKKQIFAYNFFIYKYTMERYIRQDMRILAYYQENYQDFDEALIKNNYLRYKHEEDEIKKWYDDNKLDQYDEIILLYHPNIPVNIPGMLKEKKWRLKDVYFPRVFDEPELRIYTK